MLTAITVPGQHYPGSAMVDEKTNGIPVARELFARLELDGRTVSLDALHTQAETAEAAEGNRGGWRAGEPRALVLEHGADYLLTVKGNQPTVRENIHRLVPEPPAAFFP